MRAFDANHAKKCMNVVRDLANSVDDILRSPDSQNANFSFSFKAFALSQRAGMDAVMSLPLLISLLLSSTGRLCMDRDALGTV